jgi:metallo-beta-lactamase family protein
MAVEASRIFTHHTDIMDDELQDLLKDHSIQEALGSVKMIVTAEESMSLNNLQGPCLIMAGSGMCNAGRILHHLKQNLSDPNTSVIIVGFQADGSLGRTLVDGTARDVQIFGKRIQVNATVHSLGGFSAHADQTGLLKWFQPMADDRPKIVLTHGENGPRAVLAEIIQQRYDLVPEMPSYEDVID